MDKKGTEKLFLKFYYVNCCKILMASGCNHVRVLSYIIRNTNRGNEFNKTFKEVSKATGCSESTVRRVINDLITINFMIRIPQTERYMINPECYIRGTYSYYAMMMNKYNELIKSSKKI